MTTNKTDPQKSHSSSKFESGSYALTLDHNLPHMQKLEKVRDTLPPTSKKLDKVVDDLLLHLNTTEVGSLAEHLQFAYRRNRTIEAVENDGVDVGDLVKVTSGNHVGEYGIVVKVGRIRCRVDLPGVERVYLFMSEVRRLAVGEAKKFQVAM